jgi:transcriptional regulator with XRE-family HTH domain
MDNPEKVGARIRRLRLALGYTQAKAFCDSMGIADTAWNNWEKGRRVIPIDAALKLAAKTGASLDYIYRGLDHTLPKHVADKLDAYDLSERTATTRHAANG